MAEISKMLTLSTGHVRPFTAMNLSEWGYEKGDHGWIIYVSFHPLLPEDLTTVMHHAHNLGCQWLCLDQDGPADPTLPVYDW